MPVHVLQQLASIQTYNLIFDMDDVVAIAESVYVTTDTWHQRQVAPRTTTLNSMLVIKAINWIG